MYANPIWSVLLLLAPIALYWFVIRPRLRARFTELYGHMDSFWARLWARTVAFRSYIATVLAAVAIALPDIAVAVAPIDLSEFVGKWWAQAWTTGLAVFLAVNRAFATKPGEDKA